MDSLTFNGTIKKNKNFDRKEIKWQLSYCHPNGGENYLLRRHQLLTLPNSRRPKPSGRVSDVVSVAYFTRPIILQVIIIIYYRYFISEEEEKKGTSFTLCSSSSCYDIGNIKMGK